MKLIDNRYKIDKVLNDNVYSSIYEVVDFWNDDRRLLMKLYSTDRHAKVIDHFVNDFIKLSRIKHKHLLGSEKFSIINTIDGKKVNVKQYYSTIEYIDKYSVDKNHMDLNLDQRLNIILQICSILDFLHYKGIVYKHLSPSNIFLLEDSSIKIMDLATVYENFINSNYDDLTRYFIAPEIILQQKDTINKNVDKYSLGKMMIYLLTNNFYNENNSTYDYKDASKMNNTQIGFLSSVIRSLTNRNSVTRNISLRNIIDGIKETFNIDYDYDLVNERGKLNFETKIVGREKELEKVEKIDKSFINGQGYKKAILINGDRGVGKTRLLEEIIYTLKMKGREVYNIAINRNSSDLIPIADILRQTIKDTPRNILEKYGKEFVNILPELKISIEIKTLNKVNSDIERLRLYDRITNYFEDLTKDKPIYLVIDNIGEASVEFLYLINYLVNNISYGSLMLVCSCNGKAISGNSVKHVVFNKLSEKEYLKNITITNLNLEEIGEYIQYILGISYKPLNFSATVLKECRGNPKYIEYMIKDLYASGELFLHKDGFWEIKAKKYSDIYFPSSIDEALKSQLNIIEEYMDIMKVVSAYENSISKLILSKIVNLDNNTLKGKLDELISMRLLDEMVSDWGYSYSINNIQLKKLIYYRMSKEERIELHKNIAKLLEKNYANNYKIIIEEFVYHLMVSNQQEKALNIIIEEARKETNVFSSQSVLLWEEAYEISKNINTWHKIEILESLGKIYFMKGENEKALKAYEELLEESIRVNKTKYSVIANLGIGEVYLQRSLIDLALKKAKESLKLSEEIDYLEGVAESKILDSKVLVNNNKLEELEKRIKDILEFALENDLNEVLGDAYNLLGLSHHFRGNAKKAISIYKKSIMYFQEANKPIDSTKPINNIANIYSSHGEHEKAMEYYEDVLNIIDRYGILNLKLTFLNNIGEVYMDLYNYDMAKKYIEESRNIAIDIGDFKLEALANINLGLIYLSMNDYEKSYNCYKMLKERDDNSQNLSFEILSHYYNFLGEFYLAFGKWEEALKYSLKTIEMCKEYDSSTYLMSRTRMILINYFDGGEYDRNSIDNIRAEFRNKNLNFYRRRFLLKLATISFLQEDYEYVMDILDEDEELAKDYSTTDLDYIRKVLLYSVSDDKNSYMKLVKLEEDIKKNSIIDIDILINLILGNRSFEAEKHYQTFNYFLQALDSIYELIKNIPDKDLQINYIKKERGDEIKVKLTEAIYNVFDEELDCIAIDDLHTEDKIDKYFDYGYLLSLMDDNQFTKIIENNFLYNETKDIIDIETLITRLTDDYEYNLKLILKFIAKETLAQNGYILIYDETIKEYRPRVSLTGNFDFKPNENLLSLANRYERGILVSAALESNVIGLHEEFLPKNIKALSCIPIRVMADNTSTIIEERRNKKTNNNQQNEGYIYLEADRVFNRLDEKRHRLASDLGKILYLNIENYRLKILSTIDKLTGTYTRKYFENQFNNIMNDARRNKESFAILMIDIDKFKNINDTYGHRVGDIALSRIGEHLVTNTRKTDIVARYGGEEFVIILRNIEENKAIKIGEKIRKNIAKLKFSNIENPITISIGLSMFPKHSQFREELLVKADQALYSAKEKGRNRVEIWNADMSNTLNRADKLAGILSGNINMDQRNILAILDVINTVKDNSNKKEKIFVFLGRIIEILEAEDCTLIELDNNKNVLTTYSRSRLNQEWIEKPFINKTVVERVISNKKGEFLIDWENTSEMDIVLKTHNWKSIMAIPLINNNNITGVVYVTVSIKEKEFDHNSYNLIKTLCDIFSISKIK